ncbi:MAG: DUF4157 domain-containing protein [Myxococcales bacterium]|nr:DUF4157 domain-containing protein [Myxococcales bacterium]
MRSSTASLARPLRAEERARSLAAMRACRVAREDVLQRAVDEVTLFGREPRLAEVRGARSLIAHVALASRASGIALGRSVFIRADRFGADGELPIDLVAHEVTHVAQVLRDGTAGFFTRYLAEYLGGRARGLADHEAYLAIGYEVEAREVAARVVRPLRAVGETPSRG